ncbi:MAG: hypothetical protein HYS26_02035 [Candidatus Kaiserbacteria bacterium]|nr:MAG: hypothetical protein HYS26_02035 [Candidatus Kaiserbacteria bacterium]
MTGKCEAQRETGVIVRSNGRAYVKNDAGTFPVDDGDQRFKDLNPGDGENVSFLFNRFREAWDIRAMHAAPLASSRLTAHS